MAVVFPNPEPRPRTLSPEVDFCLTLGRSLQRYGIPAHRFETVMAKVCERLGLQGQFFAQPTAFYASIDEGGKNKTYLERSPFSDVDLERLTEIQAITDAVVEGRMAATTAQEALRRVVEAPERYAPLLGVASYGVAVGAAALFLGGGWREMAATSVVGFAVGFVGMLIGPRPLLGRLFYVAGAFVAALVAVVGAHFLPGTSPLVVTAASLLPLIPGLRLIISMNELATGHLMAGTARLMDTTMIFLQLAFGVALGQSLLGHWLDAALKAVPQPLAPAWVVVSLILTPAAFVVLFKARARDYGWIALACTLAYLGGKAGATWMGPQYGMGFGAFLLGAGGNLLARFRRIPGVVTILPGLMLLVPGSLGLRSLSFIIQKQLVTGLDAAFSALFIAVALMTGLLLAHAVVPSKTEL